MNIKIEYLSDNHDCEMCGWSYAQGAKVYLDDKEILNLKPIASCYDGTDYSDSDILYLILNKLGYKVRGYEVDNTSTEDLIEEWKKG